MKKMKKFASLLLAIVMILSMTVVAFAEGEPKPYSITVKAQSDRVSLAGNTYNAYRLFDVTHSGSDDENGNYAYTVADEFKNYTYEGKTGKALVEYVQTLTSNADAINAFAEDVFKFISNSKNIKPAGSVIVPDSEVVVGEAIISLDKMGYYLVSGKVTASKEGEGEDEKVERVIAACSLDTVTGTSKEINIKADAPTIDKIITNSDNVSIDKKTNNVSIGEDVKYKVTSKVPAMVGYDRYFFIVKDTLSKGLTFKHDVVVKIGDTELSSDAYTVTPAKPDEIKDPDDATNIEIVFNNFLQYNTEDYIGKDITITYSATLNKNAEIGVEGNPNTVSLQYSNNPNVENKPDKNNPNKPDPEFPIGETPESTTYTYATGIELTKVDGATNEFNTHDRLTGAVFEIRGTKVKTVLVRTDVYKLASGNEENAEYYYALKDGSYTKEVPKEDTDENKEFNGKYKSLEYRYIKIVDTKLAEKKDPIKAQATVGNDGILRFEGLGAGEYEIEEITPPAGYNKLEDILKVNIKWNAPENNQTACTWEVDERSDDSVNYADGIFTLIVENNAGTILPSTGGIGTTIFYAAGIILMAGAVFFVVRRKKA